MWLWQAGAEGSKGSSGKGTEGLCQGTAAAQGQGWVECGDAKVGTRGGAAGVIGKAMP